MVIGIPGDGRGLSWLKATAVETCGQAETSEALPLEGRGTEPVSCVLRDGSKAPSPNGPESGQRLGWVLVPDPDYEVN